MPDVRTSCLFRTGYAGRFAIEVNGEHGSVWGGDHHSTHAGDTGVVISTL